MKNSEAIAKTWKSLVDVERYFKDGIPQQLATAVTFSGEDAEPIKNAQITVKQCGPFLPSELKILAEEIVLTSFDQFNQFLDALKRITDSDDAIERQKATKNANIKLQSCLETYRAKLSEFNEVIPQDIGNNVTQSITITGTVSGQLNIAGDSIDAHNINISLGELVRKIEESNDDGKEEVKSKLSALLKHPLVVKILGGAAGGVIG